MKKNNSKIIISIVVVIILIILFLLLFNKLRVSKITCTNKISENGIKQKSVMSISVKNNKIILIENKKELYLDKKVSEYGVLDAIKTTLEEEYKKQGIKNSITKEGNKLVITLTYKDKKKYMLDNVILSLEDNGFGINVIGEDTESSYLTFNLKDKYDKKKIIEIFNKNGYKCN